MKRKQLSILTGAALIFMLLAGMLISCDTGTGSSALEKRNCVVMLGDSIFALSGMEYTYLKDLSGQEYRTYYKSGAQMTGGSIIARQDIRDQYATAKKDGDIRTVIMDGGGNDQLLGPIGESDAAMKADVAQAWDAMLTNFKNDGVENVVIQGYYKTCTSSESASMDQWRDDTKVQLIKKGQELGLNLVYIDPREASYFTSKRPAQVTKADCIHPTDPTSKELATLVWDAMVQNNIEQGAGCPTSGGTTTPGCN